MALIVAALGLTAACGRSAPDEAADDTVAVLDQTTVRQTTTTTTTAPPPPTQVTYVIQSGDSLSVIAERFGVSTAALAEFNAISDVNAIQVGQEIRIPPADTATPTTTAASPAAPEPSPTASS